MAARSNLLLLLAAAIWGFAFVAQRVGMDYVGPFTFNGVRFALGSLSLVPLILFYNRNLFTANFAHQKLKDGWQVGIIAGLILFCGASLQQIGLIYTTAGKGAFITCLYIVLVPLVGIFMKQRISINNGIGSLLAMIGLYFLCVKESFAISYGDLLELVGAFFWTLHILWIDHFSLKVDTLLLAFFQFLTCSLLSMITALFFESITITGILQASIPILYGGICSVGIAYTLQIEGQKNAAPAHAAIILSMETVFAAIGGYLILGEQLGLQEMFGCILIMSGILLSQAKKIPTSSTAAK